MGVLLDYQGLAKRLGVPPDRLAVLEACVRRQSGTDEMMFELRMVRTLRAIEEEEVELDEAIAEFEAARIPGPPTPAR